MQDKDKKCPKRQFRSRPHSGIVAVASRPCRTWVSRTACAEPYSQLPTVLRSPQVTARIGQPSGAGHNGAPGFDGLLVNASRMIEPDPHLPSRPSPLRIPACAQIRYSSEDHNLALKSNKAT
jgi:hypothetical protein